MCVWELMQLQDFAWDSQGSLSSSEGFNRQVSSCLEPFWKQGELLFKEKGTLEVSLLNKEHKNHRWKFVEHNHSAHNQFRWLQKIL